MTDSVYSVGLLTALICAATAALLALLHCLSAPESRMARPDIGHACMGLWIFSLVAATISLLVHTHFGHGPQSVEPMNAVEFAMQHKAYWLLAGIWLLLWMLLRALKGRAPGDN